MVDAFMDLQGKIAIYIDDIIVSSITEEEHLQLLEEVFKRLLKLQLTVSP